MDYFHVPMLQLLAAGSALKSKSAAGHMTTPEHHHQETDRSLDFFHICTDIPHVST